MKVLILVLFLSLGDGFLLSWNMFQRRRSQRSTADIVDPTYCKVWPFRDRLIRRNCQIGTEVLGPWRMTAGELLLVHNIPGLMDYSEALELQKKFQAERIQHKSTHNAAMGGGSLPDVLILVEHPKVYTMGSSSSLSELFLPVHEGELEKVGDKLRFEQNEHNSAFEVHRVQRGGKITYHCPGQLVGYTIFDLARHQQDISWFLRSVEQALISLLSEYGVEGYVIDGLTGVWVKGAKIAAIGVSASRCNFDAVFRTW